MTKETIDTKNNFIFEISIIRPIATIIAGLENNEFRDCDIKWLSNKLNNFTSFAFKTLNKKIELPELDTEVMNDFTKTRFIKYFKILLGYFESV